MSADGKPLPRLLIGAALGVLAIAIDVWTVHTDPRTGDEEYGVGLEWYLTGFAIASAVWIVGIPFFASGMARLVPSQAQMIVTGTRLLGGGSFLLMLSAIMLTLVPTELALASGLIAAGCLIVGIVCVALARANTARREARHSPRASTVS